MDEENGAENSQEKFAKFLWKLDRTQEITETERQSFIGIYRLIHQVEAGDGAASVRPCFRRIDPLLHASPLHAPQGTQAERS